MTGSFLDQGMVPVASSDDAAATIAALAPRVAGTNGTITVVHVIEKAGGALDKASVEQRERAAVDMFDVVVEGLSHTGVTVETEILYGTDVAATLIDAAHDFDASAIVFTPRGGSRWKHLLSGNVAQTLLNNSDIPVVVLPDRPAEDSSASSH